MKPATIILDCGHGATTPGKRSPMLANGFQLLEWEWVREIASLIKDKLENIDIKCIIANTDDGDPSLSSRATRINKLYESEKGREVLMISLHGNAAGNGKEWKEASGWEVWTTSRKTNSDTFAKIMCDVFKEIFPDKKLRGHKQKDFTLLYKTNCPCVLTENFFYDNKEECLWMLTEEAKNKIADLHVQSIVKWLN